MKHTSIIDSIVILYVILFLYTGVSKILDYSIFKEELATSPILSHISKPVALLLPWLEFIIVVLLVIPRWRIKGLYSSLILMTIFTAYIIALFNISKEMPCSCGGIIELLSWKQHLIFNSLFILFGIWAIVLLKRQKKEREKLWNVPNDYRTYSV